MIDNAIFYTGKDKAPENADGVSTVTLVVVSVLACLASLGFLGIAIYFRRQRSVKSRVFLFCWVEVDFITRVFVLLGRGWFYHVCVCLVELRLVSSRVCLSCWVEVGFITCVFVLLG